jgi:hypothetical protein
MGIATRGEARERLRGAPARSIVATGIETVTLRAMPGPAHLYLRAGWISFRVEGVCVCV